MLQEYITTKYQNEQLTSHDLLAPAARERKSLLSQVSNVQQVAPGSVFTGTMSPELITYARLISSEETMARQDISDLNKKKYLCLLGFPQMGNSAGMNEEGIGMAETFLQRKMTI